MGINFLRYRQSLQARRCHPLLQKVRKFNDLDFHVYLLQPKLSIKYIIADLPGQIAPTGYFDPFNLAAGKSEATIKKLREAELKHGRVAMVRLITHTIYCNSELSGSLCHLIILLII